MLSVCIITKNEEKNINLCLRCLKTYGFEIIVADTGSTDRTREIALQYTEKVYDFPWCNDFAAAKNFAISKASYPYVMVIDSDEFLEKIEVDRLFQMIKQHPDKVGRIRRRNVFKRNGQQQENQECINRIFLKDKFHYKGRIHEQVTAIDGSAYETYQAPVVIEHTGYDLTGEERKEKAGRNFTLLIQELERLEKEAQEEGKMEGEEKEGEQISYILYQLGKSCYICLLYTSPSPRDS